MHERQLPNLYETGLVVVMASLVILEGFHIFTAAFHGGHPEDPVAHIKECTAQSCVSGHGFGYTTLAAVDLIESPEGCHAIVVAPHPNPAVVTPHDILAALEGAAVTHSFTHSLDEHGRFVIPVDHTKVPAHDLAALRDAHPNNPVHVFVTHSPAPASDAACASAVAIVDVHES